MNVVQMRRGMGTSGSPLPYDAEVEYLESTGTQWINTGISRMEYEVSAHLILTDIKTNDNNILFGAYGGGVLRFFTFVGTDGIWKYGYGGHVVTSDSHASVGTEYFIQATYRNGYQRLRLDSISVTYSIYAGANLPQYPIGIFCAIYNNSVISLSKLRVKDFVITSWAEPVLDLIPVRVGQVGYMYDKISGQLFGNSGTGAFILGPDK